MWISLTSPAVCGQLPRTSIRVNDTQLQPLCHLTESRQGDAREYIFVMAFSILNNSTVLISVLVLLVSST